MITDRSEALLSLLVDRAWAELLMDEEESVILLWMVKRSIVSEAAVINRVNERFQRVTETDVRRVIGSLEEAEYVRRFRWNNGLALSDQGKLTLPIRQASQRGGEEAVGTAVMEVLSATRTVTLSELTGEFAHTPYLLANLKALLNALKDKDEITLERRAGGGSGETRYMSTDLAFRHAEARLKRAAEMVGALDKWLALAYPQVKGGDFRKYCLRWSLKKVEEYLGGLRRILDVPPLETPSLDQIAFNRETEAAFNGAMALEERERGAIGLADMLREMVATCILARLRNLVVSQSRLLLQLPEEPPSIDILLDTNVLVGLTVQADIWHDTALHILESVHELKGKEVRVELYVTWKTLEEFERTLTVRLQGQQRESYKTGVEIVRAVRNQGDGVVLDWILEMARTGVSAEEYVVAARRRLRGEMQRLGIRVWEVERREGDSSERFGDIKPMAEAYVSHAEEKLQGDSVTRIARQLGVHLDGDKFAREAPELTVKEYLERAGDGTLLAARLEKLFKSERARMVSLADHKVYLMLCSRQEEADENSVEKPEGVVLILTFQRSLPDFERALFAGTVPRSVFGPHLTSILEVAGRPFDPRMVADEMLRIENGIPRTVRARLGMRYRELLQALKATEGPVEVLIGAEARYGPLRLVRDSAGKLPESLEVLLDGLFRKEGETEAGSEQWSEGGKAEAMRVELETDDRGLAGVIMDSPNSLPGATRAISHDVVVRYVDTFELKDASVPFCIQFAFSFITGVGANLAAAWLYDLLKGKPVVVRVEGQAVPVEEEHLRRALSGEDAEGQGEGRQN